MNIVPYQFHAITGGFKKIAKPALAFVFPKHSPAPLVLFRIGVAGLVLLHAVAITPDLEICYGAGGLRCPQAVAPLAWSVDRLSAVVPDVWQHTMLQILHLLFCLSLALLVVGAGGRAVAVACWFGHLAFTYAAPDMQYGVDILLTIAFFLILWFPDAALQGTGKSSAPTRHAGFLLRLLQLQIMLVYASGGWHKAWGEQWWNGEAIWRALTHSVLGQFDFHWLAHVPWLPLIVGIGTVFVELLYTPLMLWRKTRLFEFAAIILLHAGIAVALGLYFFSAVMIIYNIAAFGSSILKMPFATTLLEKWGARLRRRPEACGTSSGQKIQSLSSR